MSRAKRVDVVTRLLASPDEATVKEAVAELRQLRREVMTLKSTSRLYRIKKAQDAECAASNECYSTVVSMDSKRKWINDHDLFIADGRVFAAVDTMSRLYFMDAITGTLYDFGQSCTGTLKHGGFVRDQDEGARILMQFKGSGNANGASGGIDEE